MPAYFGSIRRSAGQREAGWRSREAVLNGCVRPDRFRQTKGWVPLASNKKAPVCTGASSLPRPVIHALRPGRLPGTDSACRIPGSSSGRRSSGTGSGSSAANGTIARGTHICCSFLHVLICRRRRGTGISGGQPSAAGAARRRVPAGSLRRRNRGRPPPRC